MSPPRPERALVRPHVVTAGRAHPTRKIFDLVTLVSVGRTQTAGLSPEKRRVMKLCQGGALSVAEVAAHLALPVSVTKVLLSDLVETGHIVTLASAAEPERTGERTGDSVLREVLDGLRALL